MRYSISGDIAQTVRLEPEPEETVWVSKRSLIAYSRGVEWTLKVPGGLEGAVVTTKGSFLGAWGEDIDIDVTVARRAGAAFFGGAGLFLQKVSGNGQVLVHGAGGFWSRIWRTVRRSPSAPGIWRHLPRVWTMTSRG